MGNIPLCLFDKDTFTDLQDNKFLEHFAHKFPLAQFPQLGLWRLLQPCTEIISAAILLLRRQNNMMIHPKTSTGATGISLPVTLANKHPFLPGLQGAHQHMERANLFLAFAVALWEGSYIQNCMPLSGVAIKAMLCWVAKCMVTQGLRDPRCVDPAQHQLDEAFTSYFCHCCNHNPAPRPQQALLSSTVL